MAFLLQPGGLLLDERNQERTYVRKITSVQKQWYKKSIVLSSVRPSVRPSVGKEEEEEEEEAGAAAAAS
jgi:hypothetical protein